MFLKKYKYTLKKKGGAPKCKGVGCSQDAHIRNYGFCTTHRKLSKKQLFISTNQARTCKKCTLPIVPGNFGFCSILFIIKSQLNIHIMKINISI